ncbi:MAG: OmpA family protein [bacterium]|nr:OmpA family protein [Candidatus Kapabacteria bacterium]
MVSSFVAGSIATSSTASITGSTDRLGEVAHNTQLSQARAEAVRDLIVAERPGAQITRVEGIGPSKLPYNNDLAEGRYYCRTVAVEVLTPVITAASAD